mgnify:CR=1 FL=1
MMPWMMPMMMGAKKKPATTIIIILVVIVVLYISLKKFGLFESFNNRGNDPEFKESGVVPDTFSPSQATQIADRFLNAFHLNHVNPFQIYTKNEVRAALSQLKTTNDVMAVADAFGSKKVPGCVVFCQKRTFGGFISLLKNDFVNEFPALVDAGLND